jgi:ribulose-5-phosphate 4-epimerase/fuculose-1-phosphate aldolase
MSLAEIKQKVLDTSKLGYSEALFAGTSGNLSVFDAESGYVAITPTSLRYDTMKLDDIVVITLDGDVIEGKHRPSSEWRMHTGIYKHRKDVLAVVHTHSPFATSFAVTHERVPLILIEMIPFIGGDIPVAGFAAPGSTELALTALEVLQDRNACLMANHGVLAVGRSIEQAHITAVYAEDAAKIYHYAKTSGAVHLVPEDAARRMRDQFK